ncbi:glycosyl hydrolase family 28 protein [Paenibacillus prosopidis]|uniref:Glycosyl hydrolase family 28 n=1 Tax=Paenibacillus prosopidis TaxID=630520 RepID=A0A368VPT5_9BACL|nr:glycosyl hydrolase family 28 protein [Paenibacillus prosopidis]RCW42507.1 glycosyl hydrolase family 28 [Paenibacillus prosopidis]
MTIVTYPELKGIPLRSDFSVRVRNAGGEWHSLQVFEVNVDMHQVREASMASFDMEGIVDVEIDYHGGSIESAVIRPLSYNIPFEKSGSSLRFQLNRPRKLSIEINGERFNNLHLFANPLEHNAPRPEDANVLVVKPGIHRTEHLLRPLTTARAEGGPEPEVLYFLPGVHFIEETLLRIPSGKTVYIAGGAAVAGSMVCDRVENVVIRGRGMLYLADFHRFSAFRGVRILFSNNIEVEGITTVNPPHYSIYIGKSENIRISNFKSFSCKGWTDGIDMMSSSRIDIDDIFLRTSDDCIAIYGSRWDYYGDTRSVTVRNSTFWADVAHPLMIGTHGDHHNGGDTIEDIRFENIDILEHHEPQPNYQGAMTINAGDLNTVRDVTYDNIRVEHFELGRLFDIRVVWNKDYNPVPGNRIENIVFQNIEYSGQNANPSRIHGYNAERAVVGVTISNLRVNGETVADSQHPSLDINEFAQNITFK